MSYEKDHPLWEIAGNFIEFVRETSTPTLTTLISKRPQCLADYIQAWVESGKGIRDCSGDYHTFTRVVVQIIHDWHQAPGLTDFRNTERRVNSVFGLRRLGDGSNLSYEFDDHIISQAHWFTECVLRELHGRR